MSAPSPSGPPVRASKNRADEITVSLREAIVSGEIRPGTPLAEPVLAKLHGASRAPVREALIALERDGLVEFNERSRTRVRQLTQQDFEEIISMRAALEGLAAQLAAQRWTEPDTRVMEDFLARQARASTLGELSRLDVEMHGHIVGLAGHRRLAATWQGIRWQFEMCLASMHRLQQKLDFEPRQITVDSHRRLLAALASGKPQHAARVMAAHIESSIEWTEPQAPPHEANLPRLRTRLKKALRAATLVALAGWAGLVHASPPAGADLEFFESEVRPLLVERCFDCHSGTNTKGGLSLETKEDWVRGGDSGPAIIPGNLGESLLVKAVRHVDDALTMPPKSKGGKLSATEIAIFEEWVSRGAPDPRIPVAKIGGMTEAEARTWWAFQPLASAAAPLTSANIDAFLEARISAAGIPAAAKADPRTLLRRLTFDLTGLPPTPQELADFTSDTSPAALSRVTDRLLASPHYGEKWGRHWLDIARYADSLDSRIYDKDGDILDAWRYRDWVVEAFNQDLPYDQFIMHQLAGDILAARKWDARKVIATGLYAIGNWGNGDADKEKVHTDIVDDQIDVTGRAFLGLTLACARCHDHKFDPITAHDYYALAGIFFSSHILEKFAAKGAGEKLMRIPLLAPAEFTRQEEIKHEIARLESLLSGHLEPFSEVQKGVAGRPGLVSWKGRNAANPSLVINATLQAVAFSTIKLPPQSIAVHPGPKVAATVAWQSPIEGEVTITANLQDADPNCGDGVSWLLRQGSQTLKSGEMNNAASAEIAPTATHVGRGDLLQLIIRPRAEYSCDTTQIDFKIRSLTGQTWDLREALVQGAEQGEGNLWWLCSGEGTTLGKAAPDTKAWADERARLTALLSGTKYAQGLQEGGIPHTSYEGFREAAIHKRGRYDQLGEIVPRSVPAVLASPPPRIEGGSGRLELANWIASAENPLTARVMANRVWQHHFGEGLVRTVNNFGRLGTPPSHPELLDALAAEFIRSGWSIKHLHRLILGSSAYQRSASPSPPALLNDPDNLLLSHQRRRRLTAEELRDAMLSSAARLDRRLGGKSFPEVTGSRRTLYLTTIRSDRSSFQAIFDGADPANIVERRIDSTVAPQSLFLLNHPFTLAQAEWLALASNQTGENLQSRAKWLWRQLFLREPSAAEIDLVSRVSSEFSDEAAWILLCQTLLCSNEFIYVD